MRGQRRPWWSLTRTKGHALGLGILWSFLAGLQLLTVVLGQVQWWRFVVLALMAAVGIFYLAAWRVRGAHEADQNR